MNFIDEFMTPEFIEKHKFYQYGRDPTPASSASSAAIPERIKQTLLYQLTNMGQPFIYVVDGNYCQPRRTLPRPQAQRPGHRDQVRRRNAEKRLQDSGSRPVHLQARIDDDMILFTYDGDQPKQQTIHDDLPKPAHTPVT